MSLVLPAANGVHYFRPDNRPLIQLFRTLGIKNLRIGGNTSDRDAKKLPGEADLDSLFGFAKAAGVKVIYCLRLHDGDPQTDAQTVKYIMDHYAAQVDCLSIGQEPSAYPVGKKDTRAAAKNCLTNRAINDVARGGQTFRPVDGATGTGAADVLARQDGKNWNIAVFNYYSSAYNENVDLASAGLPPGIFVATNLWDGTTTTVSNSFNVSLNAKQAKLFRLAFISPPPAPKFSACLTTSGNNFVCNGSNGISGWPYAVLASTNLLLPPANWTAIATNVFDAGGNFNFTCPMNSGTPQNFYLLLLQ